MRAVNLGDMIAGRDYVFDSEFAPVLADAKSWATC
jgi:hypothetical protein